MYAKLIIHFIPPTKIINKYTHKYSEEEDFIEEREATRATRSKANAAMR